MIIFTSPKGGNPLIDEALAHLSAALIIALPTDEPLIIGHVRDAYRLLGGIDRVLLDEETRDERECRAAKEVR